MSFSLFALFRTASQYLSFNFGAGGTGFVQTAELSPTLFSDSIGKGYLIWLGVRTQKPLLDITLTLEDPVPHTLLKGNKPYAQEWLVLLKDPVTQEAQLYNSPLFLIEQGASTLPEASLISQWKPLKNWEIEAKENLYKVGKREAKGVLQGHWGQSLSFQSSIEDLILKRLPLTLTLGFMAVLIGYPLSLPLAYVFNRSKGRGASAIKLFSLFLFSAPSVILGIGFLWLFSWQLKWFPLQALPWWQVKDAPFQVFLSLINPALSLGLPLLITNALLVSRRLEEAISQDYILFARAKGLSSFQIASRHLLKVSLAPLIVRLRGALLLLVSGSLVIENIFGVAGMGQLSLQALLNNDLMLALALAHLMGIVQIIGGFISEGVHVLCYPSSES